jgi:hypothetical protein
MILSIAVMHTPERPDRRAMLRAQTKALGGAEQIERHTDRYTVCEDTIDRKRGVWKNARRAWTALGPRATHHLVLQDDMLPCRNFFSHVNDILTALPDSPIGLASRWNIVQKARDRGDAYWQSCGVGSGGMLILPADIARDFIDWSDRETRAEYPHDDRRLTLYLLSRNLRVWHTTPSLLEHIGAENSTVGHSRSSAYSYWFLDNDPVPQDWSTVPERPVLHTGKSNALGDRERILISPEVTR